jgi:N-methylhydantoinase A/oxoprolinase/acetone carboxylase beta subunit
MRIAVDVGGTFTDVIVLDEQTQTLRLEKVETTPQNPASGVLQGFTKAEAIFNAQCDRLFCAWHDLGLERLVDPDRGTSGDYYHHRLP